MSEPTDSAEQFNAWWDTFYIRIRAEHRHAARTSAQNAWFAAIAADRARQPEPVAEDIEPLQNFKALFARAAQSLRDPADRNAMQELSDAILPPKE